MSTVDLKYVHLLKTVLAEGVHKDTRSGKVISLFGQTVRFNLQEELPILTTKKMYVKGVIHELLWFLKGDTNIRYLVNNNTNIWTDDAYRHYKNVIDEIKKKNHLEYGNDVYYYINTRDNKVSLDALAELTKEQFVERVKAGDDLLCRVSEDIPNFLPYDIILYKFGDLGDVYGKQWRRWDNMPDTLSIGEYITVDQISQLIDTLKNNPDDRRLIVDAWNPSVLNTAALPPCHYAMQFYSRPLDYNERCKLLEQHNTTKDWHITHTEDMMAKMNIPTRELSCMFHCRSQDIFLGTPFNWLSYAILTHMIAHCVNMSVGQLIWTGGDCHVYTNQLDAVAQLLDHEWGKYQSPKLWLNPDVKNIEDFTIDDIKILDYQSYPSIKAPLSVG